MRETKIILIDDIDGSDAVETVYFSIGRENYEIDLSSDNFRQFNDAVEKYVANARKVRGGAPRASRPAGKSDAAQIREWARGNGIDVPAKGRIPFDVRERYNAR